MAADAMGHHRLAARRAGAGINGAERVMGTAHILGSMRTTAFWCLHWRLLPKLGARPATGAPGYARKTLSGARQFKRPDCLEARIEGFRAATALCVI